MMMQEQEHQQQRHLYLVFDDWHSGYSIRKVNLSRRSSRKRTKNHHQPSSSSSSGAAGEGAEPVPEIVIRIPSQRGFPNYITSAFGPKIMVMFPSVNYTAAKPGIPIFDVQEQVVQYAPIPIYGSCPIYFRVGDIDSRLYVLDYCTFTAYLWMPEQQPHGGDEETLWETQDLPPPELFHRMNVSSHGVLPDGCLFVSTKSGTAFIFDTNKKSDQSAVWEPYGDWSLPFTGRAHYDTSVNGFVGLSKDPDTLGYLYCSGAISKASTTNGKTTLHPCPDGFKSSKETVFSKNPAERHESATLLHMCPGEFCLVECVSSIADEDGIRAAQVPRVPLGADEWDFMGGGPQACRFWYRVKTFSLVYDKEGDLRIEQCKARCFSLPHEARIGSLRQDPAAFWL